MEWKANYSTIKYILFCLVLMAFVPKQAQGQADFIINEYRAETLNKGPFHQDDIAAFSVNLKDVGEDVSQRKNQQVFSNNSGDSDLLFYLFFYGFWSKITFQQWLLIFLFFVGIVFVVFILRKMAKAHLSNTNMRIAGSGTSYDIVGDNVEDFNAQKALSTSLKEEDYRLSIRVNFIEILQKLAARGYIKWRKDKSTALYAIELEKNAPSYVNEFKEVAYIFDYIWYSEKAISKEQYQIASPYFSNFLAAIV